MKKLLIALMFIPTIARAEFLTGNDLFIKLTGDVGDRMYALGYVVGVYEHHNSWSSKGHRPSAPYKQPRAAAP
jgi:hypothetical protein